MSTPPKVFLAHRTPDKDAAKTLATTLLARGIDVWYDEWDIKSGDNFVARMEDGLARCDGGLLLCTATGFDHSWTYEEYSVMLARVVEHRGEGRRPFLIPVRSGPAPVVPVFLRVRHARADDEIDALVGDILQHTGLASSGKPPLGKLVLPPGVTPVDPE